MTTENLSEEYSLGYVRGFADTHGSLHLISPTAKNNMAIIFRGVDEKVLDELAVHLDVLGYEYKRYAQSSEDKIRTQYMLRIRRQAEVRRICEEVGFRRRDGAERASKFLAERPV